MSDSRPFGIGGPRIRVRVTAHDIAWATRDDSSRCMVARALAREVDDAHRIEVDTQTIRFSTSKGRFAYLTPLTVQRYVAGFDAGDPVEPFEFALRNGMKIRQRLKSPDELAVERLRQITEAALPNVTKTPLGHTEHRPPSRAGRPSSKDGRRAAPRVFKTRKRTYGARLLRINQPMQATALDEPVAEPSA